MKTVRFNEGEDMDTWRPPTLIPESIIEKVYIPTWENKPVELPAVLTLGGLSILTHQNLTSIIAQPGFGKSSICEAISASYLNRDADCLGFAVWDGCKGIIYIDFERTNFDVWKSFSRMCRRGNIPDGQQIECVKIAGMRSIPRLQERLEAIENLLQNNECNLLILDGAGDMVTDTNDLPQAIECRIFLRELTVKYNLSIVTTLHPNPNSTKPRGHIGGEILRESEGVLLVKKGEGDYKIITSDFEHGKNRNSATITTGYKWNDEIKMFVSVDIEGIGNELKAIKADRKKQSAENMAKIILPPPTSLSYTDLVTNICRNETIKDTAAKDRIKTLLAWDIITKRADGLYMLSIPEGRGSE